MIYQKVVCWGDSQAYGARTYGCYPLYLAQQLNTSTKYTWRAINYSTNGHTVRDLWFRLQNELPLLVDVHQACILIGVNDVGNNSPLDLFEEYYKQILDALEIEHMRTVYCGEIPPIWPDGNAFFSSETIDKRENYNTVLRKLVAASPIAKLVEFQALGEHNFVDPVHLNESGNKVIGDAFADAILNY